MLKLYFPANTKNVSSQSYLSDKTILVNEGSVPPKYVDAVLEIMELFKGNKAKMLTFYIIEREGDKPKIYISMSGGGDNNRFNSLTDKIATLGNSYFEFEFVPFAQQHNIQFFMDEQHEVYDDGVIDIFTRYLQNLFTALGKSETERNDIFAKQQFSVQHVPELNKLVELKNLDRFRNTVEIYKAYMQRNFKNVSETIVTLFLSQYLLFNRPDVKNGSTLTHVGDCSFVFDDADWSVISWDMLKVMRNDIYKFFSEEELDNYHDAIIGLWHHFNDVWLPIFFAQSDAHCAEDNLMSYMEKHLEIFSQNGFHYIFSVKIQERKTDELIDIDPPCPLCAVNLPNKYDVLHYYALGYEADHNLQSASIPITVNQQTTKEKAKLIPAPNRIMFEFKNTAGEINMIFNVQKKHEYLIYRLHFTAIHKNIYNQLNNHSKNQCLSINLPKSKFSKKFIYLYLQKILNVGKNLIRESSEEFFVLLSTKALSKVKEIDIHKEINVLYKNNVDVDVFSSSTKSLTVNLPGMSSASSSSGSHQSLNQHIGDQNQLQIKVTNNRF